MSTQRRESIKFLEEHGPAFLDELSEDHGVYCKLGGIVTFNVGPFFVEGEMCYGKQVYYLHDKHTKEEIVKKWLSRNQDVIDLAGEAEVNSRIRRHGPSWVDPANELV